MTDERWVFTQDIRDKKKTARSASKTNRQGKGPVKLPSDYMTRKELKSMNGAVMTYDMNKGVGWYTFKFWPKDIQQEYLNKINDTFHATFLDLERVFKTTVTTIRLYFKDRGLTYSSEKGRRTVKDIPEFKNFCDGVTRIEKAEVEKCCTDKIETDVWPCLNCGSLTVTGKVADLHLPKLLKMLCNNQTYKFTITFEEVNNEK